MHWLMEKLTAVVTPDSAVALQGNLSCNLDRFWSNIQEYLLSQQFVKSKTRQLWGQLTGFWKRHASLFRIVAKLLTAAKAGVAT